MSRKISSRRQIFLGVLFHEREVRLRFEVDFKRPGPREARVGVEVVDGELFSCLRHGERGAEGFRVLVNHGLPCELLLEHLRCPAVVMLEVEVSGVRVARFFECVIERIDVGFEIEIVFEHAVLEEACGFGCEGAGFVGIQGLTGARFADGCGGECRADRRRGA